MNVAMREHSALTTKFVDVRKFITLSPLSLLTSCELLFLTVHLKFIP
jgi:hypothetical protein